MICPTAAVAWFESWAVGLPESVGLAAVATLAYLLGRRSARPAENPTGERALRDLERAAAIARDLEKIATEVRKDLAAHHSSVVSFKSKIAALSKSGAEASSDALHAEAEHILAPTLKLAAQLSHAFDQLRQQSTRLVAFTEIRTDPLTGVGNRQALDEQLKLLFGLLSRYDRPFSIAIFDVDHFKNINDREGRVFGDRLLQDVANVFKQSVRETDFVARYGGEEFVVVMPQTRLAGASVFGERLRSLVEQKLKYTVSGGVSEAASHDTPQSLLNRSDSALYSAKAAGRNAVFQHNGQTIRRIEGQSESELPSIPAEAAGADENEDIFALVTAEAVRKQAANTT